jgi:hypothetical protein
MRLSAAATALSTLSISPQTCWLEAFETPFPVDRGRAIITSCECRAARNTLMSLLNNRLRVSSTRG